FYSYLQFLHLHSFPTRRSSDLYFMYKTFARVEFVSAASSPPSVTTCIWSYHVFNESEVIVKHFNRSQQYVTSRDFWKMIINITRSEEHTSELQSRGHLVCRLLL